jgi:type I restriction enzyme M protein
VLGNYFTHRVLIDVIVQLIDPKLGESCNDLASSSIGFMIVADNYLKLKQSIILTKPQAANFRKKKHLLE